MYRIHDLSAASQSRKRKTAGDALSGCDHVRDDALVLRCEPCTRAAEAGLDLVGDENDAVVVGE